MNEKIANRIISNVLKMLEVFDRKTLWHYFRGSVNYHETKTLQIDFFAVNKMRRKWLGRRANVAKKLQR